MDLLEVVRHLLDRALAVAMHHIGSWPRNREGVVGQSEMARKERSKGQRALHHHLRGQMGWVVRIHIAKMNLAFICDRGASKQPVVAIEQRGVNSALRKRQRDTTSLK